MDYEVNLENAELLIDNHHGIYIPQIFAEFCDTADWHVSADDAAVLLAGPDHADYWDTWDHVLGTAYYLADDGRRFTLWQDGDLWAVPEDAADADTDADTDTFVYCDEVPDEAQLILDPDEVEIIASRVKLPAGADPSDYTGALVLVGDGAYERVWLTESSRPYHVNAQWREFEPY